MEIDAHTFQHHLMLRAELAPNKFPVSFHSVAGNATSRCAPASAYHSISRVRINHLQFRSVAGFVIMENSQIFTSLLLPSSILQHYVNIQPVFHNPTMLHVLESLRLPLFLEFSSNHPIFESWSCRTTADKFFCGHLYRPSEFLSLILTVCQATGK